MSTHAAGPWTIQQLESEHHGYTDWPVYAIRSTANICLAIVGEVDRYESERIPANARLIAASPDLLAQLKQTVEALEYWFPYWGDPGGANSQMMINARAAIAKAEGMVR